MDIVLEENLKVFLNNFTEISDVPLPLLRNERMQAETSPFQSHLKGIPLVVC